MTRRLLAAIRVPRHVLGHELTIGASIGVVLAPQHGASAEELMSNVDLALYGAKAAGRGTFAVFEPGCADTSAGASARPLAAIALTARIDGDLDRSPTAWRGRPQRICLRRCDRQLYQAGARTHKTGGPATQGRRQP